MNFYVETTLDYFLQCLEMGIKKDEAFNMTTAMMERLNSHGDHQTDMEAVTVYIKRIMSLMAD